MPVSLPESRGFDKWGVIPTVPILPGAAVNWLWVVPCRAPGEASQAEAPAWQRVPLHALSSEHRNDRHRAPDARPHHRQEMRRADKEQRQEESLQDHHPSRRADPQLQDRPAEQRATSAFTGRSSRRRSTESCYRGSSRAGARPVALGAPRDLGEFGQLRASRRSGRGSAVSRSIRSAACHR